MIVLWVFLSALLPLSSSAAFDGPLQVKNQYPIFLHADQQYLEQASMESSLSFKFSHSNTYTVQDSGRWSIYQDMEVSELSLRYKRVVRDMVEIGVDIPVIALSGGFMDDFFESFHDTFGMPDEYGRSARPDNEFLYEVRRDGRLIVDGESGVGIGDIRIAVKKPLLSTEAMVLSARADVEIPTGNAEKGYGNGSFDAAAALLFDGKLSDDLMTYLNFGFVLPGDLKAAGDMDLEDFVYGGFAVEAVINENYTFLAQLQGQSSIYPETDLKAVDRGAWLLSLGGRYLSNGRLFEVAFTEDINSTGAADFIIDISYKVRL